MSLRAPSTASGVPLAPDDSKVHVITIPQGAVEWAAHASGALRVRSSSHSLSAYTSLAVAAIDDYLPLRRKRTKSGLSLAAGLLTARFSTNPPGLSFELAGGQPLAVDLSIDFRDHAVTVRKAYTPEAVVYGLGEKTGWLDNPEFTEFDFTADDRTSLSDYAVNRSGPGRDR